VGVLVEHGDKGYGTPTNSVLYPLPPSLPIVSCSCLPLVCKFIIKGTHIVPCTYVTFWGDIQHCEECCHCTGGIGTTVMLIQCSMVSQVMLVEVDLPTKISWDKWNNWVEVLTHFVDTGQLDFKLILTTARG
jgi:hypothetical protein